MLELAINIGWQGWFVIVLLIVTLIFLIKEILPLEVTLFTAGVLPVIVGITPTEKLFYSIANETIVTIAMLFIVFKAFEMSGIVHLIVKKVLSKSEKKWPMYASILPGISFFSAFLNNTPIVMMIVPIIRKWCFEKKISPSLFLMPVSFAAILGGVCTLIGTSTTLVVNGLLIKYAKFSMGFFEIGKIGIICAFFGIIYLIVFSKFLLPERIDPNVSLSKEMKKMVSEFSIEPGSPIVGKTIYEIGHIILKGEFSIIEIVRENEIIDAPSTYLKLKENDRIVIVGDLEQIAKLHAMQELSSVADPKFEFDKIASHYFEYTVPANSNLVGRTLKNIHFRTKYGGSVFGIYRGGKTLYGKIGDKILHPGDVLMVLSSKPHNEKSVPDPKDIFSLSPSIEIPIFSINRALTIIVIMIAMVLLATFVVSMMMAALIAALCVICFRLLPARRAIQSINWNLLVMIIGGLALSSALVESKVAHLLGKSLLPLLGKNPHLFIAVIFLCTTILTELITNTAAVLIVFPIFYQSLEMLNILSPQTILAMAITVAVAGSCSFLTPIGYQTNTIVYGPGGYRYTDFLRLGLPLNLMMLSFCSWLIPLVWPFF